MTTILIAIAVAIYCIIGTSWFMRIVEEDAIASAFGWGSGVNLPKAFISAVLWPLILPLSLVFAGYLWLAEWWKERNERTNER